MSRFVEDKKGFTLIELIVVILLLGIMAAVVMPSYFSYINRGKAASDNNALGILNEVTQVYSATSPSPNPFNLASSTDNALMQALIAAGLLSEKPTPKQTDVIFTWDYDNAVWLLAASHVLLKGDIPFASDSGYFEYTISKPYSGTALDIYIEKTIAHKTANQIGQDAFNYTYSHTKLTSVRFADDSEIFKIHARAFQDNNLTEIVLPSSLLELDYGAFLGNDITKVTIGSGVDLEGNVFRGNNSFRDVYYSQGAGTYIYSGGIWVKQ